MNETANNESSDWDKWILENQAKWLLYARQQTRSEEDAQDVLQEAVLSVWKDLQKQALPLLPHPGTVFATIRFRAINLARGRDRREQREQYYMYLEHITYIDRSDRHNDDREVLLSALKTLSKEQTEVITLKIWGELTFQQIADICQCSINTIAARYRLGLIKLQKKLKNLKK